MVSLQYINDNIVSYAGAWIWIFLKQKCVPASDIILLDRHYCADVIMLNLIRFFIDFFLLL